MRIAITMGDSSGVGPEIILHAYKKGEMPEDFVVVGDLSILRVCNRMLDYQVPLRKVRDIEDFRKGAVNVLDLNLMSEEDLRIGQVSRVSGYAALKYVECATRLALSGKILALVTMPMNKEATCLSQPDFSGHTEYIASLCGISNYSMMLASDKLIVTHVSTHVALKEAIGRINKERVLEVIKLTHSVLPKLRGGRRVAVAGLNPHAGEYGLFGTEEQREIAPAVLQARAQGIDAHGPLPPDTVFMQAVKGDYDAVVCMYHDQGHVPMKLLDFEDGVNVTLGLPIVRTSVDHGTAFDIAYKGVAFTRGLSAACGVAVKLA